MPELPEVEVTRLGLLPDLPGRRVSGILSGSKRLRAEIPKKMLQQHILGNTFLTVDRRAKYLLFRMTDQSVLVIHLGMTGKLGLISAHEPPAIHDHLRLQLDNGMELRYNDSRRFGTVLVWPPEEAADSESAFSKQIGVEPLGRGFTAACLRKLSRGRGAPIKNFLMDSRLLAGIGNIYANEILFAAAIHPQTPAGSITPGQWKRIIASTRVILRNAIQSGGSTISDFLGTSGNPGYFQVQFKVYGRAGSGCKACNSTIKKIIIGGRATFFCPHCQKMPVSTKHR